MNTNEITRELSADELSYNLVNALETLTTFVELYIEAKGNPLNSAIVANELYMLGIVLAEKELINPKGRAELADMNSRLHQLWREYNDK